MLKDTLKKGIAHRQDLRNKDGYRVEGAPQERPRADRCSVATGSAPVFYLWRIRKELPDGMFSSCEYHANVIPVTAEQALESPAVKEWLGADRVDAIYHPEPASQNAEITHAKPTS